MRFITIILFLVVSIFAAKEDNNLMLQQQALDSIKREIEALKRIKLEKANQLEKAETIRWQNRYAQNQSSTEYQNETRILEGRYAKVSDDISRMATELGALRNLATDQKEKAANTKSDLDNFYLLIKQSIDKSVEEVPYDFPAKMEERLFNFANNPPTIETYFQDKFARLELTQTQEFMSKDSPRLRLGTMFFADAGLSDSNDVKAVLRTGSVTGKVFEWRSALSKELSADIKQAVQEAGKKADFAWVPVDVLQTKAVLGATTSSEEQTFLQSFLEWFKTGGIVMYPLLFVAVVSLLIALERAFMLWRRGHISKTFTRKLHALIKNNQISEATALCKKQRTCLGKILGIIVENSASGKEEVQKSLQRVLLTEQSKLEQRMSFLAALGSVAPLIGLLGTVTGMITMFNVITKVGTNDARVLAGGISEALITTEAGLIIAIPVMLFHGKLSETLDYVSTEIRVQSLILLNMFWKD